MLKNNTSFNCPQCQASPGYNCRIYGTCWFADSLPMTYFEGLPKLNFESKVKLKETREELIKEFEKYDHLVDTARKKLEKYRTKRDVAQRKLLAIYKSE